MKNNYLITAPSPELVEKLTTNLINKIGKGDIIKYNLEETNIYDIIEEASMNSMFNPLKIIIVNNFELNKDFKEKEIATLNNYLEKSNNQNYLIFTSSKTLDKRKKIYKYFVENKTLMDGEDFDLNKYVSEKLQNSHCKMTISDIKYFLDLVGTNLNDIDNELDKLILYKKEGTITREDMEDLTVENFNDNIFAFTGAVLNKEVEKSLKLYQEFISHGYDEIMLIPLLGSQFRTLFQVKKLRSIGKTEEEIAQILKFSNPYRVRMCLKNAAPYSEKDLLNYIRKLSEIDIKIKSGRVNKKQAFELFLINKDIA